MTNDKDFKTHIKEPRWQQVASILIVIGIIAIWIWAGMH